MFASRLRFSRAAHGAAGVDRCQIRRFSDRLASMAASAPVRQSCLLLLIFGSRSQTRNRHSWLLRDAPSISVGAAYLGFSASYESIRSCRFDST